MTTHNLYRDYFNIDPKYYAAVTADLIEQGKVSWKGFYPHETFIQLLETTHKVLSGAAHHSIWVEGAYGTGKSHAALTIKSLLDASDEETEAYFNDFKLSHDLRDKFIALKNGGKIITIHRIGSADIHTDTDLILAVQQSMMTALKAHGIENQGDVSMKDAFLKWLESNPANRAYFDALIHGEKYLWDFSGMGVGDVEERLKTASGKDAESLMRRVMKALKENGQYGLFRDMNDMAGWIKSVIEENRLAGILFVWDEFSEFFHNHPFGLTGFQTLIEISQSHPFYFMIVVHESRNLFTDTATAKKILDRFGTSKSIVKIDLPDNMAFRLMAQAMKTKSNDPVAEREWAKDKASLNGELGEVRRAILKTQRSGQKFALNDEDLQNIVPIHPYAALVLKNIAAVFNSNQRSMFDFIISDDMTDAKGFKWFISEYGVYTEPNLLTVDLLWDFFYGRERAGLNDDVRGVLECYNRLQGEKLLPEERRVFKVALLLEAISLRTDSKTQGQELLVPTDENLDLAFAGTDWQKGKAIAFANGLVKKKMLFKQAIGGGKTKFTAVVLDSDDDIEKYREKVRKETNTQGLIVNGALLDALTLPPALKQRFVTDAAGYDRFTSTVKRMEQETPPERFPLLATFAMTDDEAQRTRQKIQQAANQSGNRLIFIETLTPMGNDLYEQYVDNMAYSLYHAQKNKEQAANFQKQAMSVLADWRNKIGNGAFTLYDSSRSGGERMSNLEDLFDALRELDYRRYPYGLEHYPLNNTLYGAFQPATGAEYGITQTVKGAYDKSVKNALEGAWQVENYWKDPDKQSLPIVRIKQRIDEIVQQGFDGPTGQVSMMEILEEMEKPPFGFMPSSIAAFVLGFTLKEYVREDYFWSDGLNSQAMSVEKMKSAIFGAIGQRMNPNPNNYRTVYIRAMSADMRTFLKCSASAFNIPDAQCGSVESARDQIRVRMKGFSFPLWCVTYALDKERLESSAELVRQTLNDYMGVVNAANSAASESELAERIGHRVSENPALVQDLERLVTSEKCREGMRAYLASYRDGELPALAAKIEDKGAYLEQVRKRFSAGDANWVWNVSTANEKIDDVILEYHIIDESCKTLGKFSTLQAVVEAWNMRTNNIKISCEAVAGHTGDLAPLLKQLLYMKQGNGIQEQNKSAFYNLLVTQRENFDRFYKDQIPYFTRCASAFLSGLQPEEIAELYHYSLPKNQFTKSASAYYNDVEEAVEKYKREQWVKRLRDAWYQKTRTKDPSEWSDKYETPLLCMFGDAERPAAKEIFRILMSVKPEESAAKKALEYLTTATFYDRLSDEHIRDKCFRERVVGDYAILLRDLNKIRRELRNNLPERPYEWMDNASVQNELRRLAEKEYKLTGCDRAMDIINGMNAEQLRVYLRDRIQVDADFGMQILKGTT